MGPQVVLADSTGCLRFTWARRWQAEYPISAAGQPLTEPAAKPRFLASSGPSHRRDLRLSQGRAAGADRHRPALDPAGHRLAADRSSGHRPERRSVGERARGAASPGPERTGVCCRDAGRGPPVGHGAAGEGAPGVRGTPGLPARLWLHLEPVASRLGPPVGLRDGDDAGGSVTVVSTVTRRNSHGVTVPLSRLASIFAFRISSPPDSPMRERNRVRRLGSIGGRCEKDSSPQQDYP